MAAMFGNMAFELKNRPNLHPSADDAFAAFAKMNVGVKEPKQSIGKTYKARYCAHGVTLAKDLSVLICEYGSDADAAAGLAESKKLFPGMDTRQSYTHKSLLMVTHFQEANHGGPSTAAQQKLVTTFNGL